MKTNEKGWNVTEYDYKGFKYQIHSKGMHGMKVHVFNPGLIGDWKNQVLFTVGYSFIKPKDLQNIAINAIDRILDLCNPDNGLMKGDMTFNVSGKQHSISVVHNLPETKGLSFNDAAYSWMARTNDFSSRSFCDYINGKDTEYKALTLHNYLRKGFKHANIQKAQKN